MIENMIENTDLEKKYDNGGRRLGADRRQFSYAMYLPERRIGKDRRCGDDRRDEWDHVIKEDAERRTI